MISVDRGGDESQYWSTETTFLCVHGERGGQYRWFVFNTSAESFPIRTFANGILVVVSDDIVLIFRDAICSKSDGREP